MDDALERSTISSVDRHLSRIYPGLDDDRRSALARRVMHAFGLHDGALHPVVPALPGADEVVLITYADSAVDPGDRAPLDSLDEMVRTWLDDLISTVHVLPFQPSSSDGGFSVVDYRRVDEELGSWDDIARLAQHRRVMVDLVCNHGSSRSEWFRQFLADEPPGRDYFLTADPGDDLESVVRPRIHPLLTEFATASGPRHVWTTFSEDQVDFDFTNPDVLVEFCAILHHYLERGATRVRLDAIAYLWKQVGTSSIHRPQTHEVVKLFRTLTASSAPDVLLITETNVPHAQNVSYFGDGDEAHMVYNFTLAPLIAWSVLAERAETVTGWLGRLQAPPAGCTFFNFIASHDGIGLRPIEDLVDRDEVQLLLHRAEEVGGAWSGYSAPGGPRPYEINVSLADLLAGVDGAHWPRFVVAHAVMLAVQGVPAFYVHSLFATPGDLETMGRTGHRRDINRSMLTLGQIERRLASGWRSEVFERLQQLIRVRRGQPAFAPTADQVVHVIDPRILAIERRVSEQRVLALHNLSSESVELDLPDWAGTTDLVSDTEWPLSQGFTLAPWQTAWLT